MVTTGLNYAQVKNIYSGSNSSFIIFRVHRCNEKAHKKTCSSDKEFDYSKQYFITMSYLEYIIDPYNFDNPGKLTANRYTQMLSFSLYKRNFFRYRTQEVQTDAGYLTTDISIKQYSFMEGIKFDIDIAHTDPTINYIATFESPQIFNTYSRSYIKIQDVIAKLGGFLTLINSIGYLSCFYLTEKVYFLEVRE